MRPATGTRFVEGDDSRWQLCDRDCGQVWWLRPGHDGTCSTAMSSGRRNACEAVRSTALISESTSFVEYIEAARHGHDDAQRAQQMTRISAISTSLCRRRRSLRSFDELARPPYRNVACAMRESRTLAALRDTLLPKLISGELRVEDADRFLGGGD